MCSYLLYNFQNEIFLSSLQRFYRPVYVMGKGCAFFRDGNWNFMQFYNKIDDSLHWIQVHILCSFFIEGTEVFFVMFRINGEYILWFLGAFSKLRNRILVSSCLSVSLSFCPSLRLFVCPSNRPHGIRLLLERFSWNLICKNFSKNLCKNPSLIKIWQK
jgi:hypothetical protein